MDARDRHFQAILPLRGKVINSEKNRINKVLSNAEIQAIITAIGTGIGDEFDLEKLRYHRVIVMTDADVDGSHIRTLILTFLYRQMPELVEGGHVYIAVPPLYRVKIGSQELYIEKESQFEDLLVRERVKDIEVDRPQRGQTFKFTEAQWSKFTKCAARVRRLARQGQLRVPRLRRARELRGRAPLRRARIEDVANARKRAARPESPNGYELEEVEARIDNAFRLKVTERATSAANHVDVPGELFGSPVYESLRKAYEKAGRDRRAAAVHAHARQEVAQGRDIRRSSGRLRSTWPRRASRSTRFKGLGEMDAAELWDTTMDPASRMLMRVEVEDAAEADRIFSMLMGDQVEPRREFIEQNAQDVRFLDV